MAPGRTARGGAVVGWLLIGISAVLAVLFIPLGELGGQAYFLGGLSTAPSEVIEVRRLPFTEGGRARFAVDAVHYQFQAADGRVYGGVSYTSAGDSATGRTRGTVEYRASFPGISRLLGHRMSPGGLAGLVMLAPGLVGVLLLRGGRRGR